MSWEAQTHLYQVAFSHLDKFFQYKISSDFWQGGKKLQRIFTLLSFIQQGYQIIFLGFVFFSFLTRPPL